MPAHPPGEPRTIRLDLGGPVSGAEAASLCARIRAVLEGNAAETVLCDVARLTDPDIGTVDALARLQLTARRLRSEIALLHASPELERLLGLVGLGDVVPCAGELGLEARGQSEYREEALRVEEERDPADSAT
jgi:ABC-type transporter Mla MlaB component